MFLTFYYDIIYIRKTKNKKNGGYKMWFLITFIVLAVISLTVCISSLIIAHEADIRIEKINKMENKKDCDKKCL